MFFFELPPQFKHVLRYILYLLYVHSLIHRFHNEREDEEGEGGGVYQSASSIVMRRICAVADANEKPISNTLSLQKKAIRLNNQGKTMIAKDSFVPLL